MSKIRINKRKEYKEQLRLFINMSNNIRRRIRKHFKEYADLAENLFNDIEEVPKEYYDEYYSDMLRILSDNAREVIITMGNRLERQRIVKKSDDIDSVVSSYTTTATAQNVRNITETTRKSIQAEIKLGLETGLSNPQISKNIRKSTGFSAKRATLIARTETHQAMNYGNQSIAKRLGLKKPVKEWASAMDERTRSWHSNMNGVQVGIDDTFKILTPVAGGAIVEKQLQYAGDPNGGATNTINCRCFVLYYDADDITDDAPRRPPIVEETFVPPLKNVNATSLSNPIKGSAIVVNQTKLELKEDINKLVTTGVGSDAYRFGSDKSGSTYFDDWNEKELTQVKILLQEANEIARKHDLPNIRGLSFVRKANMAMGNGILYMNKDMIKGKGTKASYQRNEKPYVLGETKISRYTDINDNKVFAENRKQLRASGRELDWTGESYYTYDLNMKNLTKEQREDLYFNFKRFTVYHEMGHHLHQQKVGSISPLSGRKFNIEDDLKKYFNTAVRKDNKLLQEKSVSKLFPTRYSATNAKEWFAENFALYQAGFKNKVSKDWLKFYKEKFGDIS